MPSIDPSVQALATALGIGLLIGMERERSKGTGPDRGPAGVRTFALVGLAGALCALGGGAWLVVAGLAVTGAYGAAAYLRSSPDDPGLTTEVALAVTFLAGALAVPQTVLAAGVGVVVAIVLASRSRLHEFARERLSEREMNDGLLLAAAALVVLPLLPDRAVDPWGVLNPHVIWLLAVLVMAINAAGYVALRTLGARRGLPLAGLAAGFVSSTATHGAMGSRARAQPHLLGGAVAGATLSSVATAVQLTLVLAVTNTALLRRLALPLVLAGVAAVAWGLWNTRRSLDGGGDADVAPGRAFDVRTAFVFTALVTIVMLAAAMLAAEFGAAGGVAGIVIAGLADTHAAAASAASLAAHQRLDVPQAAIAVLGAFSVNAVAKVVAAYATGGRAFGHRVLPGLVAMVLLAWAAAGFALR